MNQFRVDRALMLERDPDILKGATSQLTSLRDAGYLHQKAAIVAGYNSLVEYAVDELLTRVGEQNARIEALEQQLQELRDR